MARVSRRERGVVSRLSREEQAVEDLIGEAVARFALSECERLLEEYRAGDLTLSQVLWSLGNRSSAACRMILQGYAPWHEVRFR